MAFALLANALILLQLSLLLCSTTVYGDATVANHYPSAEAPHPTHPHPHPHPLTPPSSRSPMHAPSSAPVKPPAQPPVMSQPPAKPPSYLPPRKMVVVQGVVFCKACKFRGIDTLMEAAPLVEAVVKLQCNNTKYGLVEHTKTDKNGYFFFMPQKVTTMAFHKCKVFLVSSPVEACTVPTNINGGAAGALLIPSTKPPVKAVPFQLFSVGPFAFEAHKKCPCHY